MKQNIIVVPVAILLNMWMLKRKSVLFLHMALARMGLQMTLIKRAPTHHPLPLTTYGRDGSEDMRMYGGVFICYTHLRTPTGERQTFFNTEK